MPELNCNLPRPIECYMREEYMRQLAAGHGTMHECIIFGVCSLVGQSPLFHAMMGDGGIWWRAPLSAFCSRPDAPHTELSQLVLWNSFSNFITVTEFDLFRGTRLKYRDRQQEWHAGKYVLTLDWYGDGFAEAPGQHKCGHLLALDDGNYACQPNNRILSLDQSFATKPFPVCERKLNIHKWSVEDGVTEDSDNYHYETAPPQA